MKNEKKNKIKTTILSGNIDSKLHFEFYFLIFCKGFLGKFFISPNILNLENSFLFEKRERKNYSPEEYIGKQTRQPQNILFFLI